MIDPIRESARPFVIPEEYRQKKHTLIDEFLRRTGVQKTMFDKEKLPHHNLDN